MGEPLLKPRQERIIVQRYGTDVLNAAFGYEPEKRPRRLLREIAKEEGVTKQMIFQIERNALYKLRRASPEERREFIVDVHAEEGDSRANSYMDSRALMRFALSALRDPEVKFDHDKFKGLVMSNKSLSDREKEFVLELVSGTRVS